MNKPSRKILPSHLGFSLLEILVAVVLLAIIGFLVVQLVAATGYATRSSDRGIDAAAQARLAFDRLHLDLSARVTRADVDMIAANPLGAGPPYPLVFLSEVTSPTPNGVSYTNNRGVSLVAYQINSAPSSPLPCLLRAGVAEVWSDTGHAGYQTNGLPVALNVATLSAADFDALAPAVIRAAIGFQLYPDGKTVTLADGTALPQALGQIVYSPPVRLDATGNPSTLLDPARIASLVVGLVAIDPAMLKQLTAQNISDLAAAFPLPENGKPPLATWASIAENASTLPSNVPLPARQSARVFQRAFPITLTPP